MANKQTDAPAFKTEADETSEGQSSAMLGRTRQGRFAPGHCGNPNGRPRKQGMTDAELLNRILDGDTPSTSPAFAGLTLREGLLLSMCLHGLKDFRAARAVFAMLAGAQTAGAVGEAADGADGPGEVTLDHYFERRHRRRTLQDAALNKPDGAEEEGSS